MWVWSFRSWPVQRNVTLRPLTLLPCFSALGAVWSFESANTTDAQVVPLLDR